MQEANEINDIIINTETGSIVQLCNDIGKKLENKYYTYHLIDPRTDLPFYVGKGCNYRHSRHVGLVRKGKIPNGNVRFKRVN